MVSRKAAYGVGAALVLTAAVWNFAAESPTSQQRRDNATKQFNAGNFKDAYEGFRKLALDSKDDPLQVGKDLDMGVAALGRLGRIDEADAFREAVVAAHAKNWRLLETAARSYENTQHFGFIVAGKFNRGNKRGGARYVATMQRDRVRALQLFQQAMEFAKDEKNKGDLAAFYVHFADAFLNGGGYHEPWRLQYLTDVSKLPDYEEGYYDYRGGAGGAPVDDQGNPVFHHVPKSYEAAATDGERWRWMLDQAAKTDPGLVNETDMVFANFLHSQFDVQTMAYIRYNPYNPFNVERNRPVDEEKTGTFAMHTLGDDETIARLASGVKRFKLPDEFNWIKIYYRVADRGKSQFGEQALTMLGQLFEDRRHYVKAADIWKRAIADYGPGQNNFRQRRLEQIVGNWGSFDQIQVQPAGKSASVDYRFRNGTKVSFEAFAINVSKLLDDVKGYLAANPGQLDWNRMNIGDIGHRLVNQNEQQYIGAKAAAWQLDLKPRPNHVDDRVTVTTPLQKPGAYLVTAQMAGGNISRIIVWVSDTVIIKKQLAGQAYYEVADAVTGQPIPKANVEFFGWKQEQVRPNVNQFRIVTQQFNAVTDADGQIINGEAKQPVNHQWLITARKAGGGQNGTDRFAYLGFSNVWYNRQYDPEYNQTRVLAITDRPVYRPQQAAQFKLWIRHAKYDQADTSSFAGQSFTVQINNPKGEKILEKPFTADEYGGIAGEYYLPKGAMLGVYQIFIPNKGGGSFRVEEYKKPEFEVTVESPKEPVKLGDQITATIQAKYYFGAPVTKAKVKYKVLRYTHSVTWFPRGDWDWFYGSGYWWFAPESPWYRGWSDWGMRRPSPWWWGGRQEQPEVVMENEVAINPDGTLPITIDTLPAKELHGNTDHRYSITAEVVDESRRTIVGTGSVLVARKPFQVYAWLDRGFYRTGDTIKASFTAQTLDQKPVAGKGELNLLKISYTAKSEPVEEAVETWKLDTDAQGHASQQMKAAAPGQYRLSYKVTDAKGNTIEGGYLFVVRGQGFDGKQYRFNDLELITDKREYAPGEKVKLLINTNRANGVVFLFARPTNGTYLPPKVLRLSGKSIEEEITVVTKDMPNFFIEALTVSDGKLYTETREVVVPPEKRVLNVAVLPSQQEYKPGEKASVKVKLTDFFGKPFVGSTVMTIYDKSVEYVSGGSNVPEIKEFFWKWRRHHYPQTESSLAHYFGNLLRQGEIGMSYLGVFGASVVEEFSMLGAGPPMGGYGGRGKLKEEAGLPMAPMSNAAFARDGATRRALQSEGSDREQFRSERAADKPSGAQGEPNFVEPTVRKNFADTAYWNASLKTDKDGIAEISSLTMPENLTAWKIKVWAMGHGTKVGQGEAIVTTKKDLLVRLQAPRFFTQKDEVVISANVHNYLKKEKKVRVALELGGGTLGALGTTVQDIQVASAGEQRVDWRVKVQNEGEAVVRVKALTDEDSDAMEMRFPCYVHGMLKTESYTGVVRPDQTSATVTLNVPAERRINDSLLEVRYSPTLAGALVDALPYLVEYPYGCTEQTLNRFLPTVITQRVLQHMKLDLKEIEKHQVNLNSQEIGNDKDRLKGWKRYKRNPVFDVDEVRAMTDSGVQALLGMQLSDGGWGWFSGWGERSMPHTSATVVHGLQLAKQNGVALPPGMLEHGVDWLKNYQAEQVRRLDNFPSRTVPYKEFADNLDALVYMVLVDAGVHGPEMRDYLYKDRTHLAVYAKALYGLALFKDQEGEKLAMIMKNIEQYLVQDDENQTAYLRLPENNYWWCWYGSDTEANAYYLKLLALTNAKDERASRLVKYLLNNRKHATYWNSTRDTAICIEAMADYLKNSGEDRPDMTVEVWLDGKKHKDVKIDQTNLFSYDNKLILFGDAVETGKHTLEIKRQGTGPVYFNAYLTNFTLEDFITRAGLEVRVNRKYYKLTRVDAKIKVPGSKNQALDQKVEKYERTELANLANLKSGDLVEIELEIDSKNDYEYLIFEDPKAAGFEPVEVRSGYLRDGSGAYMEMRDEKVCFFFRALPRGKSSVAYRMRAEIPGQFSALPTRAYAMYAPELKGNSDEIKLVIRD
jgi:uncharacterized protein YfaS (alpha-2-macroglobulin family)